MIRGIVQYEVYTLDEGRWTLSSRYPGAQREDAIKEAGHLEFQTGRATKVVRDTYFPETNRNEEVTTYLSPKGRALQAMVSRRKSMTAVARRDMESGLSMKRGAPQPRPALRPRQPHRAEMTVRIIVAIGASVLFATIITAVVSTIFSQVAAMIPSIPPDTGNIIMAVTYLLVFLYVFPRTFRARGRIHQIILEMWDNTAKPPLKPMAEKARPRRAKERPWDLMRFDTPPPPPVLDTSTSVPPPPVIEPIIVAAPMLPPEPTAPVPPTITEIKSAKAATEEEKKSAAPETMPAPPSMAALAPTAADKNGFKLERIVLRRFAVDVVVPTVARAHRDDPVTRRGVALILAGAVQGLGETTAISDGASTFLLTDALLQTGAKQATIDNFLASYRAHISSPAAAPLLAAGKTAIKRYAEGGSNIGQLLLDALTVWRFPGMARPITQRVSYYLLSESQGLAEDGVESAADVALHDTTARMAILERGGEIIAHEGGGIFARFSDEDIARATAEAIRASIATIAGPSVLVTVVEYSQAAAEDEDTIAALEQARISQHLTGDTAAPPDETPFETSSEASVGTKDPGTTPAEPAPASP